VVREAILLLIKNGQLSLYCTVYTIAVLFMLYGSSPPLCRNSKWRNCTTVVIFPTRYSYVYDLPFLVYHHSGKNKIGQFSPLSEMPAQTTTDDRLGVVETFSALSGIAKDFVIFTTRHWEKWPDKKTHMQESSSVMEIIEFMRLTKIKSESYRLLYLFAIFAKWITSIATNWPTKRTPIKYLAYTNLINV